MKTRSFLALSLLTVLLVVSCSPSKAPAPVQTEAPPEPAVPVSEQHPVPVETEAVIVATEAPPTEASALEQPIEFVSRGPDLEATDPASVNLVSGDIQLVEFFRFT